MDMHGSGLNHVFILTSHTRRGKLGCRPGGVGAGAPCRRRGPSQGLVACGSPGTSCAPRLGPAARLWCGGVRGPGVAGGTGPISSLTWPVCNSPAPCLSSGQDAVIIY